MFAAPIATESDERPLRHELRRGLPLLAFLPVVVGAIWLAGVLVLHSRIDDWDLSAERWLADHRTPWINTVTEWGTWLAETIPVIVILLGAIIIARRTTGGWRASVFMAAVVGGEKLIYIASSILVARDRPQVSTLDETYATHSFPSGHVASAVTLYASIAIVVAAWRGRTYLIALMSMTVLFSCIVGISRMYRGFHYPSDVVAGVLIGVAWTWLAYRVLRPVRPE